MPQIPVPVCWQSIIAIEAQRLSQLLDRAAGTPENGAHSRPILSHQTAERLARESAGPGFSLPGLINSTPALEQAP